ncbi:MAG: hypothetical protein IKQ91_10770 [Oscillospiraceae bacterium]|nr:hypothetical protein [Oscillospiraceae bacterium]
MKSEKARKHRLHRAVVLTTMLALVTVVSVAVHGTVRYPGDVNTDKTIDVSDAVLLSRFIVGDSINMSMAGFLNADVDGDGNYTVNDVLIIIRQIAGYLPLPEYPGDEQTTTAPAETTSASANETTAVFTETEPESTETTAVTTAAETGTSAQPMQTKPLAPELTADSVSYPLGVSISVLTGKKQPNEMLTVSYEMGNIIFAIFADDPLDTTIAIAYQDNIVGYYKFCENYTVPEGYQLREYFDTIQNGSESNEKGQMYAIFVMRDDISIDFPNLTDKNDFMVLSKLNYYGANGIRARYELPLLNWNPELAKLAQKHSADMADHNFVSHVGSDGVDRSDRMLNAGIDYEYGGENIDYGYRNIFDALNGWLNSNEHRQNMLNKKYTDLGVGFAYNENAEYCYYGTQDFCKFFD